jgi:precorrin-6B methylase 2
LSFAFLITSSVLRIVTLELLSPSSTAILTKIGCFSTQSVTASLVYLVILISY